MKKNMGSADRVLRTLLAATIVGIYLAGVVNGALATTLLVVAGIFLVTSSISFCPLYRLAGWSTRPE